MIGNFDTRLATGNAMIYTISTGSYATNNKPGAVSTTAYGVYGDMIAGGYANVGPGGGIGFEHGYLYNRTTGTWSTYDHPDAIVTHLEGITGAGRSGEYNMVADWVTPDGAVHAGVLHVNALGIPTWHEIDIPGATLVSSNSAYGDKVVGIYLLPGSTAPNGYVATIPGIYNPIRNTGTLTSGAANAAALSGRKGDDIVNSGTIRVSGNGGIGIRGETYGVLTNSGTVVATGIAGAAVEMHGLYGTLLNSGTLQAPAVADALRTGPDSFGSVIVNTGVIDGRIAATAGPQKRFENSGWIGVTGTGVPITHLLSGIYAQTSDGTLSLRVGAGGNDALGVTGVARLAGTLAVPFQTSTLLNTYHPAPCHGRNDGDLHHARHLRPAQLRERGAGLFGDRRGAEPDLAHGPAVRPVIQPVGHRRCRGQPVQQRRHGERRQCHIRFPGPPLRPECGPARPGAGSALRRGPCQRAFGADQ